MSRTSQDWQNEKIDYLRSFKFTVAFENSRRAGYNTEKLYDAFSADTIPVYWGDPRLETIVNRDAVVFVDADWEQDVLPRLRLPERRIPYRPYFREPYMTNRLFGRANDLIAWLRARVPYTKGFERAVEEIRFLDNDDRAYVRKLAQPRVNARVRQIRQDYFDFWRRIIGRVTPARLAPDRDRYDKTASMSCVPDCANR